jgi:uncharacterized protein YutE (UPF0331/DUF86 family)
MQLNGVVQRKLALLDVQVMRLKQHLGSVTLEAFVDDWVLRSMAERALQVSVEIVIDVAERIIALQGGGPVATAAEGIERLVATGVLTSAEPFKNMVRFRNLIVHEYEVIDPTVLYDIAVNRLDDFRLFRDQIDRLC